jgi:hypothetical protein
MFDVIDRQRRSCQAMNPASAMSLRPGQHSAVIGIDLISAIEQL